MNLNQLKQEFEKLYDTGNAIRSFYAPGRVNLIGEHTDYNQGLVFPCAINYGTYLLISPNNDGLFRFASVNFDEKGEVPAGQDLQKSGESWYNYPKGIIQAFRSAGFELAGHDFLYYGNIPNGAGLSSSASIELATAFAINSILESDFSRTDLVKMSQKVENEFIGVNCGIMDQFAIGMGKADCGVFLNCKTLDYELVPILLGDYKIVIVNSNKKRKLSESKYNERVAECQQAVADLRQAKMIEALSDVDLYEYSVLQELIKDDVIRRRALHVVSENERVKLALKALKTKQIGGFARLMNESHDSLRDNYEVTGFELDTLVEEARKIDGVIAARMTGAGFGGCTVNLVHQNKIDGFKNQLTLAYSEKTDLTADFYVVEPGDGVKEMSR